MPQGQVNLYDERTPQQLAMIERGRRQLTAQRRQRCNMMLFWLACGTRACRRHRRCTGDPHACFERMWPQVPEDIKEFFRGCILAARETRSPEAIRRAGIARRAEYLRLTEEVAALRAAAGKPARAPHPAGPLRIRRL